MAAVTDPLTSKIPPQSLEAERAVLGISLLDPAGLALATERLVPTDFYKEAHRRIFEAMRSMARAGHVPDLLTLSDALRTADALEEIGGPAALAGLVEEASTLTQLASYIAIVQDKAQLRELIRIGTDLVGRAYDNGHGPAEVLARAASEIETLTTRATPAAAAPMGKVLSGPELFDLPIVGPDWAIEGVFSRAKQHMIAAVSQGAKTWTLYDLGVAVSHPDCSHFLGQPVCAHGRADIESWEQGQAEDVRRLQKIVRGRGLAGASEDLRLISDAPATLRDESYFGRRRRELQERNVAFYLIDSLSEAAGIELNDNSAYTEFWRTRIKPLLDLGVTVVFTHLRGHPKPGVTQDRDSASRGATQIRALSTTVLELRQLADTLFLVKHNKHRDSTALTFGHLELEGGSADDWIRLTLRQDTGAQGKEALARKLLTALGRESALAGSRLTRKLVEATLNDGSKPKAERVSRKIYEAVLGQMVADGLFTATKQGNADTWAWCGTAEDGDDEIPF